MATFEYGGIRYTTRTRSVFERDINPSIRVDVRDAVARASGFGDGDSIPNSLAYLVIKYTDWMQVTRIEGDVPYAGLGRYDLANPEAFKAFAQAIENDDDLYEKWKAAIEAENPIMTPEKKDNSASNGRASGKSPKSEHGTAIAATPSTTASATGSNASKT